MQLKLNGTKALSLGATMFSPLSYRNLRIPALLLLAFMFLLSLAGCGETKPTSSPVIPTSTAMPTSITPLISPTAVSPAPTLASPPAATATTLQGGTGSKGNADLLKEAIADMQKLTSYHFEFENIPEGITGTSQFERLDLDVTKQRYEGSFKTVSGSDVRERETIKISYTTYERLGGEQWRISTGNISVQDRLTRWREEWQRIYGKLEDAQIVIQGATPSRESLDGKETKHIMVEGLDILLHERKLTSHVSHWRSYAIC